MKKLNIPDASNCSITKNFTQISNDLLRNPEMSAKAKVILCILLSNKEGWHSYISKLQSLMKEKRDAIYVGIQELEEYNYLRRCAYRDIITKQWKGMFLAYTDIKGEFNIEDTINYLKDYGLELEVPLLVVGKAVNGKSVNGKSVSNNTNSNNTNNLLRSFSNKDNNDISLFTNPSTKDIKITPELFNKFWAIYPKKKGSKGSAFTIWEKLCKKPNKEKPTWVQIRKAVNLQTDSEQWQDEQFIPNASTWLTNRKWMDDPKEMISYKRTLDKDTPRPPKVYDGIHYNYDPTDGLYKNRAGDSYGY
ncbi:MAG: hypothetical protein WC827_03650 [Candidatus Paceibacterota bacterium]|jgi:hypothetical protein